MKLTIILDYLRDIIRFVAFLDKLTENPIHPFSRNCRPASKISRSKAFDINSRAFVQERE